MFLATKAQRHEVFLLHKNDKPLGGNTISSKKLKVKIARARTNEKRRSSSQEIAVLYCTLKNYC